MTQIEIKVTTKMASFLLRILKEKRREKELFNLFFNKQHFKKERCGD